MHRTQRAALRGSYVRVGPAARLARVRCASDSDGVAVCVQLLRGAAACCAVLARCKHTGRAGSASAGSQAPAPLNPANKWTVGDKLSRSPVCDPYELGGKPLPLDEVRLKASSSRLSCSIAASTTTLPARSSMGALRCCPPGRPGRRKPPATPAAAAASSSRCHAAGAHQCRGLCR
eukprot:COSAG01_NODE_21595_length_894_cov_1.690566_1_plen_176_part_00